MNGQDSVEFQRYWREHPNVYTCSSIRSRCCGPLQTCCDLEECPPLECPAKSKGTWHGLWVLPRSRFVLPPLLGTPVQWATNDQMEQSGYSHSAWIWISTFTLVDVWPYSTFKSFASFFPSEKGENISMNCTGLFKETKRKKNAYKWLRILLAHTKDSISIS